MLIAVFLPIVPHLAAVGPHSVQPGAVDPHAGGRAGQALLLPGHRLPCRRAHIRQREARQHCLTNRTHTQVLLLGCEPESEEWNHTEGIG